MNEKTLEFTVDSHLLGELGERLVTRNYIALSELVKNAYDADATKITIYFINAKRSGTKTRDSEIHLIDDGNGMTVQQVKDYWMRIATPYKVREPISPDFGRKKTGNKGIGRFACRRLAMKLIIETIAEVPSSKELEWTKVKFDWDDFKPGTNLTEIPCKYQTKRLKKGKPGLTLILKELTELWTEREFNLLRRQLLTISVVKGTRRKGFGEDPGFDVYFDAPEFPKGAGILVDQFINAGWGMLEGKIKKNGTVALELEAKRIGMDNYELSEKFKILKNIKFDIAWIPYKKVYFRDTKTLTKGLSEEMHEQGGVRVYLDGFRIYPYGNPGDDWLGIDRDVAGRWGLADKIFLDFATKLRINHTRAMLNHPRNRHLIGRIHISSIPKTPFFVKADREGFIENEAYSELVRCIRLSLQWFTLHYNKFLVLFQTEALKKAHKELKEDKERIHEEELRIEELRAPLIEKAVRVLSMEAKRSHEILPDKEKKKSKERVNAASEVIRRSFTLAETELSILRAIASTGALMFVFSHEIKALISRLETHAHTINRIVDTIDKIPKKEKDDLTQFAKSLLDTRNRFDQQVKLFGIFTQKTTDIKRKKLLVRDACNEVIQGFEYLIKHYKLNPIKMEIPDSLRTGEMLDAELFSVLVNTVSNSIKAILAGHGKNILIQGQKESGKTVISIFDDGIGLSKDFREDVFQPLTADPDKKLYKKLEKRIPYKDLAALGRGSGIGLGIIRGVTESYGGKAEFVDAKPPWKTCIKVVLP